jgi:hypothetical protein
VSVNAAKQSSVMIGNAQAYLAQWRQDLIRAAEALEQQAAGYVAVDRAARA